MDESGVEKTPTPEVLNGPVEILTPSDISEHTSGPGQSPSTEKDEGRLSEIRSAISGSTRDGLSSIPPEHQEKPPTSVEQPAKPSRLINSLRGYRWRILSAIPLERTRAAAVREQVIWAKEIDDLHPREEPLLPQGILNITEKSRGTVDGIIKQKTSDSFEFSGKTVALSTVVKEDAEQRLSVAVERISEPNGPSYIAYEILEDKITGEAVVLSHGMIDTDIGDKSDISPRIRTGCSWRQERFSSTEYPRASAMIFNALTEYVLKKAYDTDPDNVILELQPVKTVQTQRGRDHSGKEQESEKPKVAIVVLNWNGLADTEECLQSLEGISYPNAQIIVVDNASTDNSVQEIKEKYPKVRLIENKNNMGFCEGNNIGIREALEQGSDYVLILNNDTIVEPDFVEGLVRIAEKNPAIGAVIPKILYYYDRRKLWFAGIRKSEGYYAGGYHEDTGITDWSRPSDFATGCAVLIKREVIENVGLFDPRFFFSGEDTDLVNRVQKAGYRIHYTPDSVIYHKSGQSTDKASPTGTYYRVRNTGLFSDIYYPGSLRHKAWVTANFLSVVTKTLARGQWQTARAAYEGYRDYLGGKFGRRDIGMKYLEQESRKA